MTSDKQYRWRHTQLLGHAAMGQAHMHTIIRAPSTTKEAKEIAAMIEALLGDLKDELQTRVDPGAQEKTSIEAKKLP